MFAALAACTEPFVPRASVPTLDDVGTGTFAAVSAGLEHTCALTTDGTAYCWGSNEFGQLGAASDTVCPREDRPIPCARHPVAVTGGLKFQKIRAGGSHSCALGLDYHIYCWGNNRRGALGDPGLAQSVTPTQVVGVALFLDLAAGGSHSCGVRTDGVLLCWGANDDGQLGINSTSGSFAVPVQTQTPQRFASVSAGESRTCARTATGVTFCWGVTFVLQGSNEVTRVQAAPLLVAQDTLFESVTVGTRTTCGITVDNSAFCWESNRFGGIGDGSRLGSTTPRRVATNLSFIAISSGATQTCAIAADGFAYCWGGDEVGQLGVSPSTVTSRCGSDPAIPCSRVPLRVAGRQIFSQISAGQGDHVCGVTLSGNIYCWGAGEMGQRGDGLSTSGEWAPGKTRPL
jgi:alpha-tubulin suppressor-like RCC1 family protein